MSLKIVKTSILISLICSLSFTILNAQSKHDIQHIRKVYQQAKEQIAFSIKNKFEGNLYCNTLEENVNNSSWRAVGTYNKKSQFWYNKDPSFSESLGENPKACLQMVTEKAKISDRMYYKEYLFENGQLVFIYIKYPSENLIKSEELRLYFKNEKLIKQLGKPNIYSGDIESLMVEAKLKMKLFLATFGL